MSKYRCWFIRWDGIAQTQPGSPTYSTPEAALEQTRFEYFWNGPTHPKGAVAHVRYLLDNDHFVTRPV